MITEVFVKNKYKKITQPTKNAAGQASSEEEPRRAAFFFIHYCLSITLFPTVVYSFHALLLIPHIIINGINIACCQETHLINGSVRQNTAAGGNHILTLKEGDIHFRGYVFLFHALVPP